MTREVITNKQAVSVEDVDINKIIDDAPYRKEGVGLVDNFGGDANAMSYFLSFCFMLQRANSGGISEHDLQAMHSIKKKFVARGESLQDAATDRVKAKDFLGFIINATNKAANLDDIFAKDGAEFKYIQGQRPYDYCAVLAEHLPKNSGFLLEIRLTGNANKDCAVLDSIIALFLQSDIVEILAESNDAFTLTSINPWSFIRDNITTQAYGLKNKVVVAFEHPQEKESSFFAIKALVTVRNWLAKRCLEQNHGEHVTFSEMLVKERLSVADKEIDREKFLGVEAGFLNVESPESHNTLVTPNSDIVHFSDFDEDDESDDDEKVVSEYVSMDTAIATIATKELHNDFSLGKVSIMGRGVSKVKSFIGNSKKTAIKINNQLDEIADTRKIDNEEKKVLKQKKKQQLRDGSYKSQATEYTMKLRDHLGIERELVNTQWSFIEYLKQDAIINKCIAQIWLNCAKVRLSDLSLNVDNSITAKWSDPATGYMMLCHYEKNNTLLNH